PGICTVKLTRIQRILYSLRHISSSVFEED
ncbi:hypothetical protein RvY_19511, partial [Ramazzottius varieornatus]